MTQTTGPELNKGSAVAALTPPARQVHLAVLAAFAETSQPPARGELERTARAGGADPGAGSNSHLVPVGVGQPGLAHPPRAILGDRLRRDDAVHILDVEIHVSDRATIEAVLGQMQLRRAWPSSWRPIAPLPAT